MEILSLERGRSHISETNQESAMQTLALEHQVKELTRELNAVEARYSDTNALKDSLLEREKELEMHLMDVEHLKNEREGQIETLKKQQQDELERLQAQLSREERESLLELERARADKEFLRNEIAFYKRTVEELSSSQQSITAHASDEKMALAKVISELENQIGMAGEKGPIDTNVDQLRVQLEQTKKARANDEAAAREEIEWLNDQLQVLEEAYTRTDKEKRATIARTQEEMEEMSHELTILASQLSEEDKKLNAVGINESKRVLEFIMSELRALRLELEQNSASRSEAMSVAKGKQEALLEAKNDLEYLSHETKEIVKQLQQIRQEKEEMVILNELHTTNDS